MAQPVSEALLNAAPSDAVGLLDHLMSGLAAFIQDVPPFDEFTFFILINEQAQP